MRGPGGNGPSGLSSTHKILRWLRTDKIEPADENESIEPAEPTDRIEPADENESIEPTEQIDRIEPVDDADLIQPALKMLDLLNEEYTDVTAPAHTLRGRDANARPPMSSPNWPRRESKQPGRTFFLGSMRFCSPIALQVVALSTR